MDNLIELYKFYNQRKGSKVQISSNIHFSHLTIYISVIESGRLGTITQAQVSVAHGYHGISMIRKC